MNKKLKLTILLMLALICLISGGVFAYPQSSPNVSRTSENLKTWLYDYSGTKYIPYMNGTSGAMGTTSSLDVHLQRNTEYGAMLILGLSDYGKQASSVSYTSLFSDTKNGLATTTGNVSGIYNVGTNEHVAAGKPDSTYSYYLYYYTSKANRDEYKANYESDWNSKKRGDAINLFGGSISSNMWFRKEVDDAYYGLTRTGFGWTVYQTYDYSERNSSSDYSDNGRKTVTACARAVVTQYN